MTRFWLLYYAGVIIVCTVGLSDLLGGFSCRRARLHKQTFPVCSQSLPFITRYNSVFYGLNLMLRTIAGKNQYVSTNMSRWSHGHMRRRLFYFPPFSNGPNNTTEVSQSEWHSVAIRHDSWWITEKSISRNSIPFIFQLSIDIGLGIALYFTSCTTATASWSDMCCRTWLGLRLESPNDHDVAGFSGSRGWSLELVVDAKPCHTGNTETHEVQSKGQSFSEKFGDYQKRSAGQECEKNAAYIRQRTLWFPARDICVTRGEDAIEGLHGKGSSRKWLQLYNAFHCEGSLLNLLYYILFTYFVIKILWKQ